MRLQSVTRTRIGIRIGTFVSLCKYTRDTSFLLFISFLEKTAFVLPEPPNRMFHFDDAPVNTSSDKSEIGSPTKSSGT